MGLTFYGRSRVDPAVEPHVHESPPSMTVPLDPAGHPDRPARPRHRPAAGRLARSSTGSSRSSIPPRRRCGIDLPEYELFGIDGVLIIVSVAVAALGIGIGIWLFGFFRADGRPETVTRLTQPQRRDALPVQRLIQQVVVRRPQPSRLLPTSAAPSRPASCGSTCASSTASSTASLPAPRALGDGVRRIQTGRVQNYALGIALGLIAWWRSSSSWLAR